MRYERRNPNTGELLRSYALASQTEIEQALARGDAAFSAWRAASFAQRAAPMLRCAALLEERAETYAYEMALEMGKPLAEGVAEAKKCAWVCRYYAEKAEEMLREVPHLSDGSEAFVLYEPLGVVLAIMPWNFPFWQVFRFAAPTLMAGNVGLLKHAPNTPYLAEQIVSLLQDAGFPEGVFQQLRLSNAQAAEVIADPRVAAVTLTGSTRAGKAVARVGGEALKPMVMELGGSDPFVVFPDADLARAAQHGVRSRCLNNGQSCIAAKRFLIHRSIEAQWIDALREGMAALRVGDACDPTVQIGPLARADLRDTLAIQVQVLKEAGAAVLFEGDIPKPHGFFFPPMILRGVDPHHPASQEELFGPVITLYSFENEEEMLYLANATPYGLGASLWTTDTSRMRRLIGRLNAGSVFFNGMVKSDPRLPFGGIKASGFGRELGREGILAFVNVKSVWVG